MEPFSEPPSPISCTFLYNSVKISKYTSKILFVVSYSVTIWKSGTRFCTFYFRGTSESSALPFRHWYGNIIELKSILASTTQLAVFTAIATESTKLKIFEMLQLRQSQTFCLEKDPVRSNIIFVVQHIEKDKAVRDIFSPIIEELRQEKGKTERTVLFAKQGSNALLYTEYSLLSLAMRSMQVKICPQRADMLICFMLVHQIQ